MKMCISTLVFIKLMYLIKVLCLKSCFYFLYIIIIILGIKQKYLKGVGISGAFECAKADVKFLFDYGEINCFVFTHGEWWVVCSAKLTMSDELLLMGGSLPDPWPRRDLGAFPWKKKEPDGVLMLFEYSFVFKTNR